MTAAARPGFRIDATGFAVALLAHGALLWILTRERAPDPPIEAAPMEVSFVEETGPVSSAPEITADPAPSVGEELAPPEEASGAAAAVPDPVTAPVPEPVRPPVETADRGRPDNTRARVPIRPAPTPSPPARQQPRPAPPQQRAQPQPRQPQARPTPPARQPQARPGQGQGQRSTGFDPRRLAESLGRGPPQSRGASPAAPAQLSGAERQQIARNISSLIAPCAARAQPPNGFARSISVDLRVTVTRDGTPTGHTLVGSGGVNGTNDDYVDDVVAVAMRAVRSCAGRIATLPDEHYDVAGGWRTFRYRFRFP